MRLAHRLAALRLARLVLPAGTLLALLTAGGRVPAATTARPAPAPALTGAAPEAHEAVGYMPPEVRLRKLHLVRPDLILYPIAYDVYC